ncbi:MAG: ArsB/NhaD family transporter [Syntrophomonadaceae bacterium]|nr:ArsB/NhaD family transporter [Syntrophomonadaceae bacterium]
MEWQVWITAIIFLIVYGFIMSESIHRTVIALVGAVILVLIGILNQEEAVRFIDYNTIGLLLGMMVIVNIARKSGIFEFLAIKATNRTGGDPLKIMIALATVTAITSALLDNVTTVLLIVPITFSICRQLEITPLPFLLTQIMASNIGGTATLIGDPPNIMIGSAAGLGFMDFIFNLTPAIIAIFVVTIFIFKLIYGKKLYATEENKALIRSMNPDDAIKDQVLLKKSLWVLFIVIAGFALHQALGLESATIAMSGAALLMLITGEDPEECLGSVEWGTLFFFIGLFILVGGLEKVGIIKLLATSAVDLTHGSLTAASMLILWFSAIASAFIDNIPFVATFIPLIKDMGQIGGMDISSLWWALSLGACLGGNGTLIGASANVVVSGIAAREGSPLTFIGYMKIAFPLMLVSIVISMIYLLVFYL